MTDTTTTNTKLNNPPNNIAGIGTTIATYLKYFKPRVKIKPDKIDKIRELYNQWITHTHNYYDIYFIEYENTSPYSSAGVNKVSENILNATSDNDPVLAGPNNYDIFTNRVRTLINKFNSFVSHHRHRVEDTYRH